VHSFSEEAARPSLSYSSGKTRLAFLSPFDEQSVYLAFDDDLCLRDSEGLVNPERFVVPCRTSQFSCEHHARTPEAQDGKSG
jgi:hypothetical protein